MHRSKHWDWYVLPLPLATVTIWFSPESRGIRNVPILIKQLQSSCTYDTTAHDYDFLFSLSYKSSYNSAYDSNHIRKIPQSVSDTKGKTLLSGQNTETKPTTCSPQNQFQISYHFELSWERTLIYQPGKWCPCLWSEQQSGTLAYCICSYLESPDACGQNNQFCPLKITTGKQPCDFAFQLRTIFSFAKATAQMLKK